MNNEKTASITNLLHRDSQKKGVLFDQPAQGAESMREVRRLKWSDLMKPAKKKWIKLSDSEILESGGDEKILTNLVKHNYDLSIEVANKQVVDFFKMS